MASASELQILLTAKDQASKVLAGVGKSVGATAKTMGLAFLGVGTAAVGMGALAVKAAMELNEGMANVQSLGIARERVDELKSSVQQLAISTGKDTSDLAGGLYQVVSAFGDSSESAKLLEINAKAAAAGLATTEQAIALTSAVTKGYGDTSAEAVQRVADLAFQTVKLGQTTFPELASSMGKVVPIASALGVKQEVLFGQLATLTGVTGSAAEVSTQLRATFQALLKPTTEMGYSIADVSHELDKQGKLVGGPLVDHWRSADKHLTEVQHSFMATGDAMKLLEAAGESGTAQYKELNRTLKDQKSELTDAGKAYMQAAKALGPVIVKSVGTAEALALISETAGGNTDKLGKMFGSVEALTAVLALSGGQADVYKEKLGAMGDVQGAADDAFKAQTQGVAAANFALKQIKQQLLVTAQVMGDKLLPALTPIVMSFAEKLPGALGALGNALKPLMTAIQAVIGYFIEVIRYSDSWNDWLVDIPGAIRPFVQSIGSIIEFLHRVVKSGDIWTKELDRIPGILQPVAITIGNLVNLGMNLVATFKAGGDVMGTFGDGLLVMIEDMVRVVSMQGPRLVTLLQEWGRKFVEWVGPMIPPLLRELGTAALELLRWIAAEAPMFAERLLSEWVPAFLNWVGPMIPPLIKELGKMLLAIGKWIVMEGAPALGKFGLQMGTAIFNGIKDGLAKIGPAIVGVILDQLRGIKINILGREIRPFEGLAAGTHNWRGGVALVGEQGPELVNLPKGSQVVPAGQTSAIMGSGGAPQSAGGEDRRPVVIVLDGNVLFESVWGRMKRVNSFGGVTGV